MVWPFSRRRPEAEPEAPAANGGFLTHATGPQGFGAALLGATLGALQAARPQIAGVAMDDSSTGMPGFKPYGAAGLPDALLGWFLNQGFIGHAACALIAQNWLVDKALTMPARDAIRHGWDVHLSGVPGLDEDGATKREAKLIEKIRETDKAHYVRQNLEQFVKMGRLFGIRILLFRVKSNDPKYYEKPFNIDGITPGSYKGMSQVDPQWCSPVLDQDAVTDPAAPHFYDPTYWLINGKRYHRTHLCIFRTSDVPDMLKPVYQYGGIPVPQRIVERVYAAERTANEGPQLAMTKRLIAWKTDLAGLYLNQDEAAQHMATFVRYRDNYGVKLVDQSDSIEQHETSLADLDATIMTQYQLVAAAAGVPSTKLLGTAPKGFNATGEYDEGSYHEELETIQANDLTPVLDRHYQLLLRSEIEPAEAIPRGSLTVNVDWLPVDSPTAKEYAEINKLNAETDGALVLAGAIDGMDVRARLKADRNSGYTGLADPEVDASLLEEVTLAAQTSPVDPDAPGLGGEPRPGDVPRPAAVAPGAGGREVPGAAL